MAAAKTNQLLDPALLERIRGLSLVARRVVEGALHGLHRSSQHGLSVEFVQHREYSPGDELKHLDWRVLARSDRYVIKQYQQETNLRAVILLDCSRSMAYGGRRVTAPESAQTGAKSPSSQTGDPSTENKTDIDASDGHDKFHYARVLAAALAYLLLGQGESVGLVLTNERITEQVSPRASGGHILSICHTLTKAKPAGKTDLARVVTQLASRLKRRSLVILISDLLDDPENTLSALGRLHYRGHEVIALQVLDPAEISFNLGLSGHGITVIRDMETNEEFEAEPALVRDLVRAEIQYFFHRLDAGAKRHGLHLRRCPTDQPVAQALTEYLHWRLKGRS